MAAGGRVTLFNRSYRGIDETFEQGFDVVLQDSIFNRDPCLTRQCLQQYIDIGVEGQRVGLSRFFVSYLQRARFFPIDKLEYTDDFLPFVGQRDGEYGFCPVTGCSSKARLNR